ncbi:hypothetical protein ACWGAA_14615, partial [Streptomyces sp. NPDC055080]
MPVLSAEFEVPCCSYEDKTAALATPTRGSRWQMPVLEIKDAEPGRFTEQRRARFATQMANLAPTGYKPCPRSTRPSRGLWAPRRLHGAA